MNRAPLAAGPARRIGSVPYLNAVPLTRGLETETVFAPPSQLAHWLRHGELDAALVSLSEVLLTGQYDVLDGIGIVSHGEVRSVFLAHRQPLDRIRKVFCDPASLTSVNLLRVLLGERGLRPEFVPLPAYDEAASRDAVLLIGDAALEFAWAGYPHSIWDLGTAWFELTGLPFVYAAWALRRSAGDDALKSRLRTAREAGVAALEEIIRSHPVGDEAFRRAYFRECIQFDLGATAQDGVARFVKLLRRHQSRPVFAPRFVT
ncbi:MAG: menaquinone biosynthesis protein [Verrucomicrobiota bacterium]